MVSASLEAGALLVRASKLAGVQVDAARDMVASVAPIIERATDEELIDGFTLPLLAVLPALDHVEEGFGTRLTERLLTAEGTDALRQAVADTYRQLATMNLRGNR